MQTNCPECEKLNPINNVSAVETHSFEYRCECGYFVRCTDWMECEAFKELNDTIIRDRQAKLAPKCKGCGE